jgi:hypothetical protein
MVERTSVNKVGIAKNNANRRRNAVDELLFAG